MIIYYTGTGNSGYAAERTGGILSEKALKINDRIRNNDHSPVETDGTLVIVTPTYSWRIPRIVEKWLKGTSFPGAEKAWFVMTCGDDVGNAGKLNREICESKGIRYMGTMAVIMPENYIAMFNAPGPERASEIIRAADPVLGSAAGMIADGREFPAPRITVKDRMKSGIVNDVFYRFYVKADSFTASEECSGCGLCEKLCPLGNVSMKDGRPVWGSNCTHCMACICHCPQEAIEYGKASVGKPRYHID